VRSAVITANLTKEEAIRLASEVLAFLERAGVDVALEDCLARELRRPELGVRLEEARADFLIVIGGDGTVLRACLRLSDNRPLVLAVNAGGRGFLTTVEADEAIKALEACLSGSYGVEERMRISTYVDGERLPDALNEVCLTCRVPAKLFRARVHKRGQLIMALEGDGLIIATPTGSTAYSLSCGGPVVDPGLRCLLLTPICPIRPRWPLVLPPDAEVQVEVLRAREPVAVVDGQAVFDLAVGSVVRARASDRPLRFVVIEPRFYEKLAERW